MVPKFNRECLLFNEESQIFGTIDGVYSDDNVITITDYKTGNIPVPFLNPLNYQTDGMIVPKVLPYTKKLEGNFYITLYLLARQHFMISKFADVTTISLEGIENNLQKNPIKANYQFLYTDGDGNQSEGYVCARQKASIKTIRTLFRKEKEIRECTNFERKPYPNKCKVCSLYFAECEKVLGTDSFYRNICGSKDTSKEDVLDSGDSDE
jgi:hypothetical protein